MGSEDVKGPSEKEPFYISGGVPFRALSDVSYLTTL